MGITHRVHVYGLKNEIPRNILVIQVQPRLHHHAHLPRPQERTVTANFSHEKVTASLIRGYVIEASVRVAG